MWCLGGMCLGKGSPASKNTPRHIQFAGLCGVRVLVRFNGGPYATFEAQRVHTPQQSSDDTQVQ